MARYACVGDQNAAASGAASGITKVESPATTRRASIYEWSVGPEGTTPADQNYTFRLKRQTSAGTWSALTPAPLDPNDAAALMVSGTNSTGAGSASTILMEIGCNSRAGYRWVAVPGGEPIVTPTSANGIILEFGTISGGTELVIGTLFFQE